MRIFCLLLILTGHINAFCQKGTLPELPFSPRSEGAVEQIKNGATANHDTVAMGRVIYEQQVQLAEEIPKNGTSALLFNATCSVYITLDAPLESKSVLDDNLVPRVIAGDKYGFPYYKLHQERKIIFRDKCIGEKGKCLVEDTLGGIAWSLQPEHKRFGKYDGRRATGFFRGREYEVWYTLDIPIPSGPFKLGGLPGLILEAQTTDGAVKFLFSRLEIGAGIPNPIKPPPGKPSGMNYETYMDAKWEMVSNLIKSHRAAGNEITISPSLEVIELWEPRK